MGIVIGSIETGRRQAAQILSRGVGRWLTLLCIALVFLGPSAAEAQSTPNRSRDLELGTAANGLCGLVTLGMPTCTPEVLTVAVTTGYGYTESLGSVPGSHHRFTGTASAGFAPLQWLALALSLDGRLDTHPKDTLGTNRTATGNPRLYARAGRALPKDLTIGGEAAIWFPGHDAPSFDIRATTLDLKTLLAWAPRKQQFTLLTNVGFRIDSSANSAPDLRRTRAGDRVALGLSDSHAFLIGVGGAYQVTPIIQAFGEAGADLLFGSKAPRLGESPLRMSAGARYFFHEHKLAAEFTITALLSGRPGLKPTDPLVPTEPRIMFTAGVRYNAWQRPRPAPVGDLEAEKKPVVLKTTESISGIILDDTGAPLPEAVVKVVDPNAESEQFAVTNRSGRYVLKDLPFGPATLEASAVGFQAQNWETDVYAEMPEQGTRTLVPEVSEGALLRGLVRSFGSTPLIAQVTVTDRRGKQAARVTTDEQGRFEISLPQGKYRVVVKANGYKQHRVQVDVAGGGVSILNVDMRQE